MQDLLSAFDSNAIAIRQRVGKALGVLGAAENGPLQYHHVMRELSELLPYWIERRQLYSQAGPLISRGSGCMAIAVLRQFDADNARTASLLEVTSSAGWARIPALGNHALQLRAAGILGKILCQLEKERTTIVPLVRRSTVRRKEISAAMNQMATA
jgi:hypothetical protein